MTAQPMICHMLCLKSGKKHHRNSIKIDVSCQYSLVAMFENLRQSVDISKDEVTQNLAETIGLLRFIRLALRCQEGGLGLLGTPCNSFGWMASSQHERTFASPWGNMTFPFVIIGNLLATRSCLVVSILVVRSVFWMLENPDRSKVAVFPPLMHLMSISDMWPLRVYWWGPQLSHMSEVVSSSSTCTINPIPLIDSKPIYIITGLINNL
jgi:hypothetical protein